MLVVIGSINLDLIATVHRLPEPGETVAGSTFRSAPGGKGANQALAAARAGADVRMIGAVGIDSFADEALSLLSKEAVDLGGVSRVDAPTGTALILVAASGENVIAVVAGANGAVLPDVIERSALTKGDIVLLQNEIPLETVAAALDAARLAGATSILNTAPYSPSGTHLLGKADIVVANESEFDLIAAALDLRGETRHDRMKSFVERTGRTIVVTLGGDGVVAETNTATIRVPALPVTPLDTVGAGDTFCGYLGASLEAGADLEEALRRAAVAGSLACLTPGAQPSIPIAADVERALG